MGSTAFKAVLDFAQNSEHKLKLLRAIGSFGNTDNGGHIILGVDDDRNIIGLDATVADSYDQTPVQRIVNEFFAPPPQVYVRQHKRDGKRLVIVQVLPFKDFPCIVKRYEAKGKEVLREGTFLVRNGAAESGCLSTEAELRKLCDAIIARRARSVIELFQRGIAGMPGLGAQMTERPAFTALDEATAEMERVWPSSSGKGCVQACFAPQSSLSLPLAALKELFPAAAVPDVNHGHGYPFVVVSGAEVYGPSAWGFLGRIPFQPKPNVLPGYLWAFHRNGGFVYREQLWEDESKDLKGSIGIFHIVGITILTIRLLDRLARKLEIPDQTVFRIGISLTNVDGRSLQNEQRGFPEPWVPAMGPLVDSRVDISLGRLRESREDTALNLLEDIAWQGGRRAWTRQDLTNLLRGAGHLLGRGYAFPSEESV